MMGGPIAPLDFGAELWKWDVKRYESAEAVRAARARVPGTSGSGLDDDNVILFEATWMLVRDVIDAAGGVEGAYVRLLAAMADAQASYDRFADANPPGEAEYHGFQGSAVEEAWYALEEVLVWARTMDERLKRQSWDRDMRHEQGLIPALADGPRREAVVAARSRLLNSGLGEARLLSGLNLHMQPMQAGRSGRVDGGRVALPFPDRVSDRVEHRSALSFGQGRDGVAFADQLMSGVEQFMDEMIKAFEAHVPERLRSERLAQVADDETV